MDYPFADWKIKMQNCQKPTTGMQKIITYYFCRKVANKSMSKSVNKRLTMVRVLSTTVRKILKPINQTSRHRWSPDQRACSSLSYVRRLP